VNQTKIYQPDLRGIFSSTLNNAFVHAIGLWNAFSTSKTSSHCISSLFFKRSDSFLQSLNLCSNASTFTCQAQNGNMDNCSADIYCTNPSNNDLIQFGNGTASFSSGIPWFPLEIPSEIGLFTSLVAM
jgi:hypothetical protein